MVWFQKRLKRSGAPDCTAYNTIHILALQLAKPVSKSLWHAKQIRSGHMKYDLIIFDCDGVLVDSEMLSATVLMKQLSEIGIDLDFDQFRADFLGRSFASARERLRENAGQILPDTFQAEYFTRLNALFATDLRPMEGANRVLETIVTDHCVASSSIPPRLDFSLQTCGLAKYFGPRVYSAVQVVNAKPAPDLFQHAAKVHKVDPPSCLVIEDSEMGVLAAKAAGMDVWHFAGGSHVKAGYALPPDLVVNRVVEDMRELYRLFKETGICRGRE
jgi:HAD superfamily hydrolase (TIGR01509 family)